MKSVSKLAFVAIRSALPLVAWFLLAPKVSLAADLTPVRGVPPGTSTILDVQVCHGKTDGKHGTGCSLYRSPNVYTPPNKDDCYALVASMREKVVTEKGLLTLFPDGILRAGWGKGWAHGQCMFAPFWQDPPAETVRTYKVNLDATLNWLKGQLDASECLRTATDGLSCKPNPADNTAISLSIFFSPKHRELGLVTEV